MNGSYFVTFRRSLPWRRRFARSGNRLHRSAIILTVAALVTLVLGIGCAAEAAFIYEFDVAEDPSAFYTFSGSGQITFDSSPTSNVADITAFDFDAFIPGFADLAATMPTVHSVTYGLADIDSVVNLTGGGASLSGSIDLGGVDTADGKVSIFAMSLDFTNASAGASCAQSGDGLCESGTSTFSDGLLSSVAVPVPSSMTLLSIAMAVLAGYRRPLQPGRCVLEQRFFIKVPLAFHRADRPDINPHR